jgi:hypothetical protein
MCAGVVAGEEARDKSGWRKSCWRTVDGQRAGCMTVRG